MLTTIEATEQERRVADALIAASKRKLSGDVFWLEMARAAIAAHERPSRLMKNEGAPKCGSS